MAAAFPSRPGVKVKVSEEGGSRPRWSRESGELFYLASDKNMMVARIVEKDSKIQIVSRSRLFYARTSYRGLSTYDVTPDGQRFLILIPSPPPPTSLTLVQNWHARLAN